MAPRVLISDKLSPTAVQIFRDRGIEVDYEPELGKDKAALLARIGDYDGLAVRSATKVTSKVIDAARRLKVIGRAGIGVDNIDVSAATARGIIVMNTPLGNAVTTAEHTIAMMLALARNIPQADVSTKAGRWEKSRFMGVEVFNKTLGLIGCGNIGSIVASRAQGLKMRVIAYDPYLSPERAEELGVEKVELDELLARADFLSLHTPLTDKTRGIINAEAMAKMKKGARIINCARGGLVVEKDLLEALKSGHIAGAALDVFEEEPARDNPLFALENVICTPHLGASTTEAQENVAVQIAEQMADYLLTGAVTNALNMPSISAEEAPKLKPFIRLAELLGAFIGQIVGSAIEEVTIEYAGTVGEMNTRALSAALLAGLLRPIIGEEANMVSAPVVAKERGMNINEVRQTPRGVYEGYIRLEVRTENSRRTVAGTVFSDGKPRMIQVKDINMEAEFAPHMLYVVNEDRPGFIGALGQLLGEAGVNIATMNLGRTGPGGEAVSLIAVDEPVPDAVLEKVRTLPQVKWASRLAFHTES